MERDLPEGWEWVTLDKTLELIRNGISSKQNNENVGYPVTRIETISEGKIDPYKIGYVSEDKSKISRYKMIPGDILFSHINSVKHMGKTALYEGVPEELYHGVNLLLLRPKKAIVSPKYLEMYLSTPEVRRYSQVRCKKAVNQASLNQQDINKIKVPLPPLETQRRIVATLEKAEETKRLRAQADELADWLIQSVFLEMFGDPATNPKGWDVKDFDHLAKIDTVMTTDFIKYADYPHIGIENIKTNTGELIGYKKVKEQAIKSGKYVFTSDHIIYSKIRPNLNKVALPYFDGLCSADAYPILVNNQHINKYFLVFILRSGFYLNYVMGLSSRTNIPKVNKQQLRGFNCICPPIRIQNQFAQFVQKVEAMKQSQARSAQEIDDLFNALMQKAFTGELTT